MTLEEMQAENEKLKKALADAKGGGMDDDERKQLEFLKAEHKTLIEARDKAKEEKRKAEEKRLEENSEFKTLAEQRQAAIDALTTEQATLAEQLASYQQRDTDRLGKLIEKVPETFRGLITDDLPLAKRLEMAETFATTKPETPKARLPGERAHDGENLTSTQRIARGLQKGAI